MTEMHNDEVAGIMHLKRLAVEKKSVHCPKLPAWKKPKPAGWVLHLQGNTIAQMLEAGLFIYDKPKRR